MRISKREIKQAANAVAEHNRPNGTRISNADLRVALRILPVISSFLRAAGDRYLLTATDLRRLESGFESYKFFRGKLGE